MIKISTGPRRYLGRALVLGLILSAVACEGRPSTSDSLAVPDSANDVGKKDEGSQRPALNAGYVGTKMLSPHSGCSFLSSPINFCDQRHRVLIEQVIAGQRPNFNERYIVAELEEWPEVFQRSVVVINTRTGVVYPLPIDALSGPLSISGHSSGYGAVETSVDAKTFCLVGAVLAYRSITEGRFCFGFDGSRFTGYRTAYMTADEQ